MDVGATGADVVAHALKEQGVEFIFGVAGRMTILIANASQRIGIKYIGTRNEQSVRHQDEGCDDIIAILSRHLNLLFQCIFIFIFRHAMQHQL